MSTRRKVVLFGDSLVLEGIGHSLERYPRLEIIHLDASSQSAVRELQAVRPSAVLLDLSTMTTSSALSLLADLPDVLLIGLDPGGDKLVVFSGQKARSLSTADLVQLIEGGAPREMSVNGGDDSILS